MKALMVVRDQGNLDIAFGTLKNIISTLYPFNKQSYIAIWAECPHVSVVFGPTDPISKYTKYSTPERKYSPSRIASSEKIPQIGRPDPRKISTSYIERQNASTRLHVKRLNRLTLAFSKKRKNFEAAVALNFAAHNFVRTHSTLKMTPAMAAGVERNFWSYGDLVEAVL